jgi:protein-tyrosine-phosphatase
MTQKSVLFVCLHGAAKSVIAAHYLEQMAAARGIPLRASSAGLEPDEAIPPHVVAGLREEGIDVRVAPPALATEALVNGADHVVSFGCDVAGLGARGDVTRWDDVPMVSDGYAEARAAIVTRVQELLDHLSSIASPPATRP